MSCFAPDRSRLFLVVLLASGCGGRPPIPIDDLAPNAPAPADSAPSDPAGPELSAPPAAPPTSSPASPAPSATPPAPPTSSPAPPASPSGALADDVNESLLAAILATPAAPAATSHTRWDGVTTPAHLDLVQARFQLLPAERERLFADRFVVLDRESYDDFFSGFADVYRSEVPLYVSADAIFAAVATGHDTAVAELERTRLSPLLGGILDKLHAALAKADYPRAIARDLDLYLTVGRSLLAGKPVKSTTGVDTQARGLVATLVAAHGATDVDLFGRSRRVDASAFLPRSYYIKEHLEDWFRAAMWVSRLEWNLVSRSCRSSEPGDQPDPSETPREAADAVALARLVIAAGVEGDLATVDGVWRRLAGPREDVPLAELARLADGAGIGRLDDFDDVQRRLAAAIGNGYARTMSIHPMPQGTTALPVIASLLGPAIVTDTRVTYRLANDAIPERGHPTISDVAYALGLDRAKRYLADDLARFPTLGPALDGARAALSGDLGDTLYARWLTAIRALARPAQGIRPSFMEGEAFGDLRLGSLTAAWAQLKHAYVLFTPEPESEGGCLIPDGFVDPVPDVYDALARYADTGLAAGGLLGDSDSDAMTWLAHLGRIARGLAVIARRELADVPLTPEMQAFLNNVADVRSWMDTGQHTSWLGWYVDLFPRLDDALASSTLIADWFTDGLNERVVYAGVGGPQLGLFIVDTAGPPRVVVGPVADGYEHLGPRSRRLTDEDAERLTADARAAPWSASYRVPSAPEPDLKIRFGPELPKWDWPLEEDRQVDVVVNVTVTGKRPARDVTLELLDHHQRVIVSQTHSVGDRPTHFQLAAHGLQVEAYAFANEGVRVRSGDFIRDIGGDRDLGAFAGKR